MEAQVTLSLVLAALGLMDLVAIVLLFLQGRYLARMNEKIIADDVAIFLPGCARKRSSEKCATN
jgi:uncharacterized membrane protein YqjE